jgi:hypothetical protein
MNAAATLRAALRNVLDCPAMNEDFEEPKTIEARNEGESALGSTEDAAEAFAALLAFAESIANHTSGNLHGFYSAEIKAARAAVLKAGGTLLKVGRYEAGAVLPTPFR